MEPLVPKKKKGSPAFIVNHPVNLITSDHINFLKSQAEKSIKKRARLIFYNEDEVFQQALRFMDHDSYFPIHEQKIPRKSFLLMEGELKVLFYDESKTHCTRQVNLNLNAPFLSYDPNRWHRIIAGKEGALFLESQYGPSDLNHPVF